MNPPELDQNALAQLHALASKDTPQGVNVSPEKTSLIVWALGRFGVGVVFAYSAWMMYTDNKALTERIMMMTEKNMELNTKHMQVLDSLKDEIQDLRNQFIYKQYAPPSNSPVPQSR